MIQVLKDLQRTGALYTGEHFVLKSGKHSEAYINPDVMLTDPYIMDSVTVMMAEPFFNYDDDIVCVGPAFGGNYLAWDVARHLGGMCDGVVKWVATVKTGKDDFALEPDRGFEEILVGSNVLVVEDLLTTGGSVMRVVDALWRYGGFNLIGITAAVNRGGVTADQLGVPQLHAAANVEIETDEPDACRWCTEGRPIVEDIGHGDAYKAAHPGYKGGYVKLLAA